MTSFGSFAVILGGAPPLNDVPSRPPLSIRFGADADGGNAATACPESERFLSSSALKRPNMSSIARRLSIFALSSADFAVGVFKRVDPRLRALPKGPFSSGIRVRWLWSLLSMPSTPWFDKLKCLGKETLETHTATRDCAPLASMHLFLVPVHQTKVTYSANSRPQGNLLPVESNARSASGTAWTCIFNLGCGGVQGCVVWSCLR